MAQIQIWTRDVDGFEFLHATKRPQHTFLIKINDDGTREILRGGPATDMVTGDIEIIRTEYSELVIPSDYYDPLSGSNPLNYQGQTIKTAPQSEIDSLWNAAWTTAQNINTQNYDYEAFTQNCNSTTALLAETMGLKTEVSTFLSGIGVETPGFDYGFNTSIHDKIYDLITHPSAIFAQIISFVRQNPNTEFENGNTNTFNNIVKQALEQKLQQSLAIDQSMTSSYTQFQSSVNTVFVRIKDPLIIDGGNDGLELNSLETSRVLFDLDGDGNSESTGWVKSSSEGGDELFLAIDKNQNGNIDSIEELFGNDTTGGFAELSVYDSNQDNIINSSDSQFNLLKIWNDANANGIVDSGEINSLTNHNITSISLNTSNYITTINGNNVTAVANVNFTDGSVKKIYEVWFGSNEFNSAIANPDVALGSDFELNLEVLTEPFLRGYGFLR